MVFVLNFGPHCTSDSQIELKEDHSDEIDFISQSGLIKNFKEIVSFNQPFALFLWIEIVLQVQRIAHFELD